MVCTLVVGGGVAYEQALCCSAGLNQPTATTSGVEPFCCAELEVRLLYYPLYCYYDIYAWCRIVQCDTGKCVLEQQRCFGGTTAALENVCTLLCIECMHACSTYVEVWQMCCTHFDTGTLNAAC